MEKKLKKIINEAIKEVLEDLKSKPLEATLSPASDDDNTMMASNVSTATWRESTEEKVETKLLEPNGIAHFHNHGCIVANYGKVPIKAICTEMNNKGQRAYYVRLDEA